MKALIIVGVALMLLGAFLAGTVVGFNVALKSLSDCEETPCEQLGVQATSCEVCKADGFRVLARSG